jgi:hypothetical protein
MLGRLKMSTKDALKHYNTVAERVFSGANRKWAVQDGTFKAATLEREMKRIIASSIEGGTGDERMLDGPDTGVRRGA